ncbi:MAG TPA: DsbA family protein [Candidatus Paceibacterota bacterium]|nr:DsbA family protein [Candidatus Paceibacterota bacterium]
MPCLIALIVFGIMGIFSASHRALAKEALSCVFRRVTFRPCNSNFKDKIKDKILSKLINRSVLLTKIVNKHYELLSWIFFILMAGSMVWVLRGGYNFYVYGSCNGLNSSGFCAFDPSGENNKITAPDASSATCGVVQNTESNLTLEHTDLSIFPSIKTDSENTVVFIGCYACDYSRKAYPEIKKLVKNKNANYIFAHFPVKGKTEFLSEIGYVVRKDYGDQKFWELNDYLFTADVSYVTDQNNINSILTNLNIDAQKVQKDLIKLKAKEAVQKEISELTKTGIFGTPTVFINSKAYVGPKPFRVYRSAINKFIFF